MRSKTDLLVIGGGPAGGATAIWACKRGLNVTLLRREKDPVQRPGETLHPGVEPIFAKLGVLEAVLREGFPRHEGYWVEKRDGERSFVAYGQDERGVWKGFQACRRRLDAILLKAAEDVGVQLIQTNTTSEPTWDGLRVNGVAGVPALFTVDATGRNHWLARRLGLEIRYYSRTLIARYGYTTSPALGDGEHPVFQWEQDGWRWSAPIGQGRHAMVALRVGRNSREGPMAGADVSWRIVPKSAGAGYFLAGDAASVIDPSASQGVLRALMSGMLAADLSFQVLREGAAEASAAEAFREWTSNWFEVDRKRLRELYGPVCIESIPATR